MSINSRSRNRAFVGTGHGGSSFLAGIDTTTTTTTTTTTLSTSNWASKVIVLVLSALVIQLVMMMMTLLPQQEATSVRSTNTTNHEDSRASSALLPGTRATVPGDKDTRRAHDSHHGFATAVPYVLIGLNYQMGNGASDKLIPFACERNDRVVILTNVAQTKTANEMGPCVEIVQVDEESYNASISEMPYRFTSHQKVYFDRWYVLRDWMRATNTSQIFTTDSDAVVVMNITNMVYQHSDVLDQYKYWISYEPPRCTFAFALLTLDFLNDYTTFLNEFFRADKDYWTQDDAKKHHTNDMIGLGHYIHTNEGPKDYQCWANRDMGNRSKSPGTCDTSFSSRRSLDRLWEDHVMGKFQPGSFGIYEDGESSALGPEVGLVDKQFRHDPTGYYEAWKRKRYEKRMRFVEGQPQILLQKAGWYRVWGYILEDELEDCVDSHLSRIRGKQSCACYDVCCDNCTSISI